MNHTPRKRIWTAVIGAAISLGIILVAVRVASPREPEYQGKPEHVWLAELQQWDGDTNDAAFRAFEAMGPTALPGLMAIARRNPSPLSKLIDAANEKQSMLKIPGGRPWEKHTSARFALYAMGTNALPALPELTNMLFDGKSDFVLAAVALGGLGKVGLPPLLLGLTNSNFRVRQAAANSLGYVRADVSRAVPDLILCLKDSNGSVRENAIMSLGDIHARPEISVPTLLADYPTEDAHVRAGIIFALEQFGPAALPAIPTIKAALNDPVPMVRQLATNALKEIDPQGASSAVESTTNRAP